MAERSSVITMLADAMVDQLGLNDERRLVGMLHGDATDDEIEEFLSVLNEGIPEAN